MPVSHAAGSKRTERKQHLGVRESLVVCEVLLFTYGTSFKHSKCPMREILPGKAAEPPD